MILTEGSAMRRIKRCPFVLVAAMSYAVMLLFPGVAGAQSAPGIMPPAPEVTFADLERRPLPEIAAAIRPLISGDLELSSFDYYYSPLGGPATVTAVFDHRRNYAGDGTCVQSQWVMTFRPVGQAWPDERLDAPRIDPRGLPLELHEIGPRSLYWAAERDIVAEDDKFLSIADGGVDDSQESELAREVYQLGAAMCAERPDRSNMFTAPSPGHARTTVPLLRSVLPMLASADAALSVTCNYTTDQCLALRARISMDTLTSARQCEFGPDRHRCMEFTFDPTGRMGGNYVRMFVRTETDFEAPSQLQVEIQSWAFVVD